MKIGIIEFLYHHIFLYSLALIAKACGAKVTIFTTSHIYGLVAPLFGKRVNEFDWIFKNDKETRWAFLKRVQFMSSKLDLLFVNTLQGTLFSPIYTQFKPKCKAILVMGRVTDWFEPEIQVQILRNFCNRSYRCLIPYVFAKRILPIYDAVVVHTIPFKEYLERHGYKRNVYVLPYAIYEKPEYEILKSNNDRVKFLVTGSLERIRRDYEGLLNAFEIVWNSGFENAELTLLGRPEDKYGIKIMSRAKSLRNRGYKIKYFYKYIPEDIYNNEVCSANILINPVRPEMYAHGMFMSGLVEAIRHAKPGVYPTSFYVPTELSSSSLFYDKIEELHDLLLNTFLKNRQTLENLSQNAILNTEPFSLQKVASYFQEKIIKQFLSYQN
jgi:hypothetical protein